MTAHFDREPAAVDMLLRNRSLQAPPPELRKRVLTAVDDVLHDDGPHRRVKPADGYKGLMVGVLMVTALSLLFVVTVSRELAWQHVGPSSERPLLSFAERVKAAGIALELEPTAAERLASVEPSDTASPRRADILRPIDSRTLLQGDH